MSDIVERLRKGIEWTGPTQDDTGQTENLMDEAADEITSLRAEVEKLKAALRLRADAEEHCLDAVNYVGRYNSGERIEEARGRVRNAFTDFEEAEREALGDTP